MSLTRIVAAAGVVGAVTAMVSQAQADSITVSQNVIIDRSYDRPAGTEPLHINRRDCEENAQIKYSLTVQAPRTRPLEVWIGKSPCDSQQRRSEIDCRLLATLELGAGPEELVLGSKEIVGENCQGDDQPSSSPITQILFIAFLGTDGAPNPSEGTTQPITLDVVAPDPPNLRSVQGGDGSLFPSWEPLEGADVSGYRFYCSQSSGPIDPTLGSAGAASQAACGSQLVSGEVPDESLYCGQQAGQSAGRGTINGVENGLEYAVGVVANDTVGNVGKLSNIECGTPAEVTDFFEAYTMAGGKGGGGFCSLSERTNVSPWPVLLMAAIGAGFFVRRRLTQ